MDFLSGRPKTDIVFSKDFNKLAKDSLTTIRWPTSTYLLGNTYELVLIGNNAYRTHYPRGKARLVKLELVKLKELSEEFIREDAECSLKRFIDFMRDWYGSKKGWAEWESEVQVLYLEKVKPKNLAPSLEDIQGRKL